MRGGKIGAPRARDLDLDETTLLSAPLFLSLRNEKNNSHLPVS